MPDNKTIADLEIMETLENALDELMLLKPDDRSKRDRHYAIVKTDLEKLIAYFKVYVVDG